MSEARRPVPGPCVHLVNSPNVCILPMLQSPVFVVMPHCTSRVSAMTREPVIKAEEEDGRWVALQSAEVTMEGYKVQST